LTNTIEGLEATVTDSVPGYVAETELDTQIDTVVEQTKAQVAVDAVVEEPVTETTIETEMPEELVAAAPTKETEPATIDPVEAEVSTEAEAEVRLVN